MRMMLPMRFCFWRQMNRAILPPQKLPPLYKAIYRASYARLLESMVNNVSLYAKAGFFMLDRSEK